MKKMVVLAGYFVRMRIVRVVPRVRVAFVGGQDTAVPNGTATRNRIFSRVVMLGLAARSAS